MANAPGPLLRADALVVGHGDVPVCAPVTLSLTAGAALALVGPNGAGKSTLLQTLVGLLPAIEGTVRFDGQEIDERQASFRRNVAEVLDDDAFFPSLTAREHLLLTARGHGVEEPEEAVEAELAAFGLIERADALPRNLSSGQRRRLALAAAFVRPARLLVLDEPERRLDTAMRDTLAERLASARESGATVLFASHDAAVVRTVARTAVLLDDSESRVMPAARAADAMTSGDG